MRKPPLSMMIAALPSHLTSRSCKADSSSWTSSSISWGSVAISRGLPVALVDEFVQEQPGYHVQRLEHSLALVGGTRERWHLRLAVIKQKIHILHWSCVREIAFVKLQHIGNVRQVEIQALE